MRHYDYVCMNHITPDVKHGTKNRFINQQIRNECLEQSLLLGNLLYWKNSGRFSN